MLYIFIVVFVALQRSVSRHALSQDHRVNDSLTVNAITDRRNQILILFPVVILEIKQDSAIIRGFHIVTGKSILARKGFRVLRSQKRQIQFPGLHLDGLGIIIRHNLKNNGINVRLTLEVIHILLQSDGLAFFPVCQLVRTCSYRMTEEIRLLHILSLQQMLRQNRHSHVVQKCHIRCAQLEGNGVGILHGDLLHILIVRGILRTIFRIHDRFDRKLDIICGKFLAVMPLYALLQMERISAGSFIKAPVLCQRRNHLILSVMRS